MDLLPWVNKAMAVKAKAMATDMVQSHQVQVQIHQDHTPQLHHQNRYSR